MAKLSDGEIDEFLGKEPAWRLEGGMLVRDLNFKDFVAAMKFVNSVAEMAEQANHHPDIDIRYNRVRVALSSHDESGVTSRDTGLAGRIELGFGAAGGQ